MGDCLYKLAIAALGARANGLTACFKEEAEGIC